jgi:competence protein ComEC
MGLLGNILGMPVFTLLVMPMGVVALVLMPFGLAVFPLTVMDAALKLLLAIAKWTAGLGLASERIVPPGATPTLILMTGLFVLVLARGRWRYGAVPFAVMAGLMLWTGRPPDVQISAASQHIAARYADGELRINASRAGFETDLWLQAEGMAPEAFAGHRMNPEQRNCDDTGCVFLAYARHPALAEGPGPSIAAQPLKIAMPKTVDALMLDCTLADVIVTDFQVPDSCGATLVFDAAVRNEAGAISLWLNEEAFGDRSSGGGPGLRAGSSAAVQSIQRTAAAPGASRQSQQPEHSDPNGSENTVSDMVSLQNPKTGRRTVVSHWRTAKTRPPRPWHRLARAPE